MLRQFSNYLESAPPAKALSESHLYGEFSFTSR